MPETRRVPDVCRLQQDPAETAEDELVSMTCVVSDQMAGTVVEPIEDKARWFCGGREVEHAKCGFSVDCEGCRVAASGDEVLRPHGKECRERIEVTRMCDDAGQLQQHRSQELRQLRRVRHRLQGLRESRRIETKR